MESTCCQSNDECCKQSKEEHPTETPSDDVKCISPEQKEFADNLFVNIISKPVQSKEGKGCGESGKGNWCAENMESSAPQSATNMAFEGDGDGQSDASLCDVVGSEKDEKSANVRNSGGCCSDSAVSGSKGCCGQKPAGDLSNEAGKCCSGSTKKGSCSSALPKEGSCCSAPPKEGSRCSTLAKEDKCCSGSPKESSSSPVPPKESTCCSAAAKESDCCSVAAKKDGRCSGSTKESTCNPAPPKGSSCSSAPAKESSCGSASGSSMSSKSCSESSKASSCCSSKAKASSCDSGSAEASSRSSCCAKSSGKKTVSFSDEYEDQSKNLSSPSEKLAVKGDCCSIDKKQSTEEENVCFDNAGEKKSKTCCSKTKESKCSSKEKNKAKNAEKGNDESNNMPNLLGAMGNKVTYGSFQCCDSKDRSGCLFTCQRKNNEYVTIPCDSSDKDTDAEESAKIPDVVTTTKLRIQNICCGKEAELMKRELEPLIGIEAVSVNVVGRIGFVKHNANVISTARIVSILNNLHLGVSIMESGHHDDNQALNKEFLIRLGTKLGILLVLAVLFIAIIVGRVYNSNWRKWVAIAEIVIGGLPILRKTILNWMKKVFVDINVLMLIAVIGTVALQEWLEGATVVFVFAIAECLQEYCTYRVQKAISGLMVHIPEEAVLAETGKSVPVEDVDIGSIIVVCAGEKIPLDGRVIKGQASVDESSITGESMPIEKSQGDQTYSGTIVQNGYLEIVTTSDSLNSTVSKVTQLVQEAQGKASRTEEIMNKFAKVYTPLVLTSALLIFAIPAILAEAKVGDYASELHWWGVRALIVLLIACPCALVMSVPMPVVCGITAAARNGVLIKGGTHMENLAKIKTVALDKTGTLTEGRFRVVNIQEFGIGLKYNQIMEIVAALEIKSSHPVASAIVNHYSGCITDKIATFGAGVGLPDVFNFKSLPGLGLSGQVNGHAVSVGNLQILQDKVADVPYNADAVYKEWSRHGQTVIFVVIDSQLGMMIGLADNPRPTAKLAIHMLKDLNIETIMLTGDSSGAAAAVMKDVGAKSFIASMKPEEKLEWIREQQSKKNEKRTKVAMVGDGVNDGPSLAAADVGIAIGACATALAIESAGVALMSDSLVKIPEMLILSKFTRRVVFQNIALALAIKIAVMIATLVGSLTLWMAVLSDVAALLLVILNGFRPLLWKRKDSKETDDNLKYTVDTIDDIDGDYEGIALIQIKS